MKPRCPVCGIRHRKLPADCITADVYPRVVSYQEMAKYLKEAGFWEEFCEDVERLREALEEAGRR